MKTLGKRLSQTFEDLSHSNQLLQLMMDDLREVLDEPMDSENLEWVTVIVDKMLANLHQQKALERKAEYAKDVLERFPTWYPQMEHIWEQQDLLHRQLRQIRRRLKQAGSPLVSRETRRELKNWLDAYEQLRRREANLIHEAFVLDVGEGE